MPHAWTMHGPKDKDKNKEQDKKSSLFKII